MSHDTHNSHDQSKDKKVSVISFKNSFWLVIIIVGLFVAALSFIKAESGGEESSKEKTEASAPTERADMQAEQPKQTEPSPPDSAYKASK